MANIVNGKYGLIEPGDGITAISMEGGEINLFGKYTLIRTIKTDVLPPVKDLILEEKEIPQTDKMYMAGMTVATIFAVAAGVALFGALTAATGGAALLCLGGMCVFAGAALETAEYTASTVVNDLETGNITSGRDFAAGLVKSGMVSAVKGAGVFAAASTVAVTTYLFWGGSISALGAFLGIGGSSAGIAGVGATSATLSQEALAMAGVLATGGAISLSATYQDAVKAVLSLCASNNPLGRKEVSKDEDEGVKIENGSSSKYKGQSYNGTRNPDADFINGKGKSTLNKHANKHGYSSPEEYLRDARNFLEKQPTSTTESFVSNEGTYFRYDTSTNEFGIINEYGGISTYFEPEDGLTYWLEQIELYAPK